VRAELPSLDGDTHQNIREKAEGALFPGIPAPRLGAADSESPDAPLPEAVPFPTPEESHFLTTPLSAACSKWTSVAARRIDNRNNDPIMASLTLAGWKKCVSIVFLSLEGYGLSNNPELIFRHSRAPDLGVFNRPSRGDIPASDHHLFALLYLLNSYSTTRLPSLCIPLETKPYS